MVSWQQSSHKKFLISSMTQVHTKGLQLNCGCPKAHTTTESDLKQICRQLRQLASLTADQADVAGEALPLRALHQPSQAHALENAAVAAVAPLRPPDNCSRPWGEGAALLGVNTRGGLPLSRLESNYSRDKVKMLSPLPPFRSGGG